MMIGLFSFQVLSIETHFAGKFFPGTREDILNFMTSVGYIHFPSGHANTEYVRYSGQTKVMRIVNDLFVRKDIAAGLEVKEALSGNRGEL